jgi:hypothetical protein
MHLSDDDLRQALRPEEPPVGFADRVLASAGRLEAERRRPVRRHLLAAAAVGGMIVAGGTGLRIHQARVDRAEGMRAKEAVIRALRVTSEKLQTARAQVQHVGRKQFEIDE